MFSVLTGYIILGENEVCTWKMPRNYIIMNGSLEICVEKTSTIGTVGATLCDVIKLC